MAGNVISDDDPWGSIKSEKRSNTATPKEVNDFHSRSDLDSSTLAQHHTLGIKHDQACPGDHTHDGTTSRKLAANMTLTGSKGGNVALGNLITLLATVLGFTDSTT